MCVPWRRRAVPQHFNRRAIHAVCALALARCVRFSGKLKRPSHTGREIKC
jgi:hypothetical protein